MIFRADLEVVAFQITWCFRQLLNLSLSAIVNLNKACFLDIFYFQLFKL